MFWKFSRFGIAKERAHIFTLYCHWLSVHDIGRQVAQLQGLPFTSQFMQIILPGAVQCTAFTNAFSALLTVCQTKSFVCIFNFILHATLWSKGDLENSGLWLVRWLVEGHKLIIAIFQTFQPSSVSLCHQIIRKGLWELISPATLYLVHILPQATLVSSRDSLLMLLSWQHATRLRNPTEDSDLSESSADSTESTDSHSQEPEAWIQIPSPGPSRRFGLFLQDAASP